MSEKLSTKTLVIVALFSLGIWAVFGLLMHYVFNAPGWATFMGLWIIGNQVNTTNKLNSMGKQ